MSHSSPRRFREEQLILEATAAVDKAEVELASLRARQPVERPLVTEAIDLRLELALSLLRQVTGTVATKQLEKRIGILHERLAALVKPECDQLARALIKFDAAGWKPRVIKGGGEN